MYNSVGGQIEATKLLETLETMKCALSTVVYIKAHNDVVESVAPVVRLVHRHSLGQNSSQLLTDYYKQLEAGAYHPTIMEIKAMLFLNKHKYKILCVNTHIHCSLK